MYFISTHSIAKVIAGFVSAFLVLTMLVPYVQASSHREAPLTASDSKVDATDLYAFVSPDKPDTITLIANYIPFEEPAGGPNFDTFDDKALYEINIDNNGDATADIIYQFRFKTTVANPNTFLYNTGPVTSLADNDWNVKQTYTLTKYENGIATVLGEDLTMPPVNIGPKSTPNYGDLQADAIHQVGSGVTAFAGQSDDPFFVDLGSLFDLLTIRVLPGNAGGGINTTQGFNVHSLALQIPISQVTLNKNIPTMATDASAVIGVWTTASRAKTRVLTTAGTRDESGEWVQVSRLGSPMVNEVVIPVGFKDRFNASNPKDDAQFANFVANPEVPTLLSALYGIVVPPQGDFGSTTMRDDLTTIFLTGIPGLTKPADVQASEQLRLNVAVTPTTTQSALGLLGGDQQGYPNGRRLADDVVDISLRAMAGAAYPLFHPAYVVDPTGAQLGDGVDANDLPFRANFPYLALPHSGYDSEPHTNSSIVSGLNAIIAQLRAQIASLLAGVGGGSTGGGSGGSGTGTSTATSTPVTPPAGPKNDEDFVGRLTPTTATLRPSGQINFSGRDFSRETDIVVTLNGMAVGRGHADGGGNFTTGSITTPTAPGTYVYRIVEVGTDNVLTSTVTIE